MKNIHGGCRETTEMIGTDVEQIVDTLRVESVANLTDTLGGFPIVVVVFVSPRVVERGLGCKYPFLGVKKNGIKDKNVDFFFLGTALFRRCLLQFEMII